MTDMVSPATSTGGIGCIWRAKISRFDGERIDIQDTIRMKIDDGSDCSMTIVKAVECRCSTVAL
jgi:hypothetical protein